MREACLHNNWSCVENEWPACYAYYQHYPQCLSLCSRVVLGLGFVCIKNYPAELMQPSSSTRTTIVSTENQNDETIVKAVFFFCQYYIVFESNNTGKVRGQSWNESLKTSCIPEELCGLYEWYKAKIFCCAFFAAAIAAATIVRPPPPPDEDVVTIWCWLIFWSCFKIKKNMITPFYAPVEFRNINIQTMRISSGGYANWHSCSGQIPLLNEEIIHASHRRRCLKRARFFNKRTKTLSGILNTVGHGVVVKSISLSSQHGIEWEQADQPYF